MKRKTSTLLTLGAATAATLMLAAGAHAQIQSNSSSSSSKSSSSQSSSSSNQSHDRDSDFQQSHDSDSHSSSSSSGDKRLLDLLATRAQAGQNAQPIDPRLIRQIDLNNLDPKVRAEVQRILRDTENGDQPGKNSRFETVTTESRMVMTHNGHTYEVVITDGEITRASRDDVPLAKNRVRMNKGQVEFLNADGSVEFAPRVRTRATGGSGMGFTIPSDPEDGRFMMRQLQADNGAFDVLVSPKIVFGADAPRGMIGITMDAANDALLRHLGLEPGSAVLISSVMDDMPAKSAGLCAFDLITKVNGQSPATEKLVRDAVANADAGQTITLDIVSKGQHKTVSVQVEAFDEDHNMFAFDPGENRGVPIMSGIPLIGDLFADVHIDDMTDDNHVFGTIVTPDAQGGQMVWVQPDMATGRWHAGAPTQTGADSVNTQLLKEIREMRKDRERLESRIDRLEGLLEQLVEQRATRRQ